VRPVWGNMSAIKAIGYARDATGRQADLGVSLAESLDTRSAAERLMQLPQVFIYLERYTSA
jgi:hypothetical protein